MTRPGRRRRLGEVPGSYASALVGYGVLVGLALLLLKDAGVTLTGVVVVAALLLSWSGLVVGAGVRVERRRFHRVVAEHTAELAGRTAALQESERHFRLLAECSGDVVVRHLPQGELAWVSPMVTDILGWRPDDLAGRTLADLVHPEDRPLVEERTKALRTGDRMVVFDTRMSTSEGGYRWIQASMTLAGRAGESDGVSVWRDVQDAVESHRTLQQAQREREAAERRLRTSLDVIPLGFARFRLRRDDTGAVQDFVLEYLNAPAVAGAHRPDAGDLGSSVTDYFPQARAGGLWLALEATAATQESRWLRYQHGYQHGSPLAAVDGGGEGTGRVLDVVVGALDADTLVVAWQDVTAQVQGEASLAAAYEETAEARVLLHLALDSVAEPFSVWDVAADDPARTVLMMTNPAAAAPRGRAPEEVLGWSLVDLYGGPGAATFHALFRAAIQAGTAIQGPDVTEPGETGDRATLWRPTLSPMGENRVAMVLRDVTLEVSAARRLERERDSAARAARVDALTGLLNRRGLHEELATALTATTTHTGTAVVFADLDGFKQVNDTHGHEAGDALLVEVAARLRSLVRAGEAAARPGGDEFVLVLRDLPPDWDQAAFVARAHRSVTATTTLPDGTRVRPAASFGVVRGGSADRPEDLLRAADAAMYVAKRRRRTDGPPASRSGDAEDLAQEVSCTSS